MGKELEVQQAVAPPDTIEAVLRRPILEEDLWNQSSQASAVGGRGVSPSRSEQQSQGRIKEPLQVPFQEGAEPTFSNSLRPFMKRVSLDREVVQGDGPHVSINAQVDWDADSWPDDIAKCVEKMAKNLASQYQACHSSGSLDCSDSTPTSNFLQSPAGGGLEKWKPFNDTDVQVGSQSLNGGCMTVQMTHQTSPRKTVKRARKASSFPLLSTRLRKVWVKKQLMKGNGQFRRNVAASKASFSDSSHMYPADNVSKGALGGSWKLRWIQ